MFWSLGGLALSIPISEPTDPDLSRCFVSLSCGWLRSLSNQESCEPHQHLSFSLYLLSNTWWCSEYSLFMQGLGKSPTPKPLPSIQFSSHLHHSKICSRPPSLLHSHTNDLEIIKLCMIYGLLASRNPWAPLPLPCHWAGMRPEDTAEPGIGKISCVSWHWRTCWRANVMWTSQNPTRLNQRHPSGSGSLPGTWEGFEHFDCMPHRITEYLHLEGTQKDHRVQLLAQSHQWRKLNNHMWRDKIESRFNRTSAYVRRKGKKKSSKEYLCPSMNDPNYAEKLPNFSYGWCYQGFWLSGKGPVLWSSM